MRLLLENTKDVRLSFVKWKKFRFRKTQFMIQRPQCGFALQRQSVKAV